MMKEFNSYFDTLFLPIQSKIYVAERFPNVLYDETALSIKDKIPKDIKCISKLTEYTYLSGCIRAKTIDEKVDEFLCLNPNGVVVELNSRLSTACYRLKVTNKWYCVDNARNLKIRKELFNDQSNVLYINDDIFKYNWLNQILENNPNVPILIISIGVFNYYPKSIVTKLINHLLKYDNIELIFDAVNSIGMKRMKKYYLHIGIVDYKSLFCLNDISELKLKDNSIIVLDQRGFFNETLNENISLFTRFYMKVADMFKMIQLYHIITS